MGKARDQSKSAGETRANQLSVLLKAYQDFSSTLELDQVLYRVLGVTKRLVAAERSSIWRLDEKTGELHFMVIRGDDEQVKDILRGVRMKVGEGVVGWVAEHGRPLIVPDVTQDPRWSGKVDDESGFRTRSIICAPIQLNQRMIGVVQLVNKKGGAQFGDDDLLVLESLSAPIAIAIDNATLYEEKRRVFFGIAVMLADVIEKRDKYTGGHVQRVLAYADAIAQELELAAQELETVKLAAILHDMGKIAIPDRLLNEPRKLTPEEFGEMKEHATVGARILESSTIMNDVIAGVRHHHERYDGSGYPDGLAGEEIPLVARIIQVADVLDAMTSDRPYRKALTFETAIAELRKCAGSQFCPQAVAAFERACRSGAIHRDPASIELGQ